MNKILKSFVVIITISFLILSVCLLHSAKTDFAEQIDSEEGSMFEKDYCWNARRNCTSHI